ncbi:5481_t:CDS:1, partial [Entrophospora sp. SA101]
IVISIVFLRNPFVFYRPHCAGDFGMPALNATLDTLGQLESGKSDSSSYSTTDSLNFTGKYRFGEDLLVDLGYYELPPPSTSSPPSTTLIDSSITPTNIVNTDSQSSLKTTSISQLPFHHKNLWLGKWTGKNNCTSYLDFLNNKQQVQELAIRESFQLNLKKITENLANNTNSYSNDTSSPESPLSRYLLQQKTFFGCDIGTQ